MQYIVDSAEISDLEKAIAQHGHPNVWWLADSTRSREATLLGLPNSRMLAKQNFTAESALALFGEHGAIWVEKVPAKKAPAKKPSSKKEE
jgi:hypothetical protein